MVMTKKVKTKTEKYIVNRVKGLSKKASAIEAGYSETTAHNATANIEHSKEWNRLLNTGNLSDECLTAIHSELLASTDARVQLQALGLGYKIKGKIEDRLTIGKQEELAGL